MIDPQDIKALERVLDFAYDLMLEEGQKPDAPKMPENAAPHMPPGDEPDAELPDEDGLDQHNDGAEAELPMPRGKPTFERYSFHGVARDPQQEEKPQHKFPPKRRY